MGGCGWPHPRDDPPVNTFRVVHCSTDVPRKTLRGDLSLKSRQPEGTGGAQGARVELIPAQDHLLLVALSA